MSLSQVSSQSLRVCIYVVCIFRGAFSVCVWMRMMARCCDALARGAENLKLRNRQSADFISERDSAFGVRERVHASGSDI